MAALLADKNYIDHKLEDFFNLSLKFSLFLVEINFFSSKIMICTPIKMSPRAKKNIFSFKLTNKKFKLQMQSIKTHFI